MYDEKSELMNFVKHRFKGIGRFYDNLWNYDFDSEEDGSVTIRDRDTMEQVRLPIDEVKDYILQKCRF